MSYTNLIFFRDLETGGLVPVPLANCKIRENIAVYVRLAFQKL